MNDSSKLKFQNILKNEISLQKFDLNLTSDPEANLENLHNIINQAHTNCFANKRVRIDRRRVPKMPWITFGLVKSIKTRNKLYKKLKNTRTNSPEYSDLNTQLKHFGKVLKKSIKAAKKDYYAKLFDSQRDDPRKIWSTINSLTTGTNQKATYPDSFIVDGQHITDSQTIADKFNSYFLNIASKMTENLGPVNASFKSYLGEDSDHNFEFQTITELQVTKAIDSLKSKRTLDCYGLSTEIVKLCRDQLVPVLTVIVNQSITTGIFPDQFKLARVSAIDKKGDKCLFENYRPISILPILSKIIERLLHDQLCLYFTKNNLFYTSQYGFRKHHSTELAALQLLDQIISNLEAREQYISFFMDLSKAFDCLNHSILLDKLHHYGIQGKSLELLKNYLQNRQQYVEFSPSDTSKNNNFPISSSINCKVKSKLGSIEIGVPQGSILGPLLFIIYINDFCRSSSLFSAILYADDTTFSTCIDKFNINEPHINLELEKVSSWLNSNRLCLNVSKTKYMIFDRTSSTTYMNLNINNKTLEQVKNFKFLGLQLTETLDWSLHTKNICSKLSRNIGILRRLRCQLPPYIMKILYYTLIHSHLNYMILIWGNNCQHIQTQQKKALRIIHSKHYLSHTDPLFKSAKILKVNDLFIQQQLQLCRKYINGQLPQYFMDLELKKNSDNHNYNTIHRNMYILPKIKTEISRRLVKYFIPNIMNNLSITLREALYASSDDTIKIVFKRETINSYSDTVICDSPTCWPCRQIVI